MADAARPMPTLRRWTPRRRWSGATSTPRPFGRKRAGSAAGTASGGSRLTTRGWSTDTAATPSTATRITRGTPDSVSVWRQICSASVESRLQRRRRRSSTSSASASARCIPAPASAATVPRRQICSLSTSGTTSSLSDIRGLKTLGCALRTWAPAAATSTLGAT